MIILNNEKEISNYQKVEEPILIENCDFKKDAFFVFDTNQEIIIRNSNLGTNSISFKNKGVGTIYLIGNKNKEIEHLKNLTIEANKVVLEDIYISFEEAKKDAWKINTNICEIKTSKVKGNHSFFKIHSPMLYFFKSDFQNPITYVGSEESVLSLNETSAQFVFEKELNRCFLNESIASFLSNEPIFHTSVKGKNLLELTKSIDFQTLSLKEDAILTIEQENKKKKAFCLIENLEMKDRSRIVPHPKKQDGIVRIGKRPKNQIPVKHQNFVLKLLKK